jgi:FKBP-type peptidyl-prolyl cis-trans isomerase
MARLQAAYMELMDQRDLELMQSEAAYLAENARKPGIIVTPSGLQYEIIEEGTGEKPGENDVVKVHYDGKFVDGDLFDSSYSRGYPVEFALDEVVPGWMEGMQLMKTGSKYRFYIPSELAYGPYGNGPIPPYSTLIFEVELIEIIK